MLFVGANIILGTPNEGTIFGPPSLWPEDIDSILCEYNSPACGQGQIFWEQGVFFDIDPAALLAFFKKESSFATDPNSSTSFTYNIGAIECTNACYGRWQRYSTWGEGSANWYSLMNRKYRGMTLEEQIYEYAPPYENNTELYIEQVRLLMQQWRTR